MIMIIVFGLIREDFTKTLQKTGNGFDINCL